MSQMEASAGSGTSSVLVTRVFEKRKREFVRALQQILVQVSHDQTVRHLLQNRESSKFVTARIEQIVSSVLTDNREHFIDALLQKLQNFEALYSSQHTSSIRQIGDRILSVTNEQNMSEIGHVRTIQSLVEQVRGLQDEVVRLNGEKTDESVTTSDFKKFGIKKRYVDPAAPQFYSIFATVNLTDFKVKMKLIETDARVTKEMMVVMARKMREIFTIVKDKSVEYSAYYRAQIEKLKESEAKAKAKVAELKRHFDTSIVPKLLEQHSEAMTKQKRVLQEKVDEVEELKGMVAKMRTELKQSNNEREQLLNAVRTFEQQRESDEAKIQALKGEKASDKNAMAEKTNENEALVQMVQQLKADNAKLNHQLSMLRTQHKELQENLDQEHSQNVKLGKDIEGLNQKFAEEHESFETAKKVLDETEGTRKDLDKQLRDERQKNKDLAAKTSELELNLSQAEEQLAQTKQELRKEREDNRAKSNQIAEQEEQIADMQRHMTRLEGGLEHAKSKNDKNQVAITHLEEEKCANENTISQLQHQLKKEKAALENTKKELEQVKEESAVQKDEIAQTSRENDKVKDELERYRKTTAKLEDEIKKLSGQIHNMEEEGQEMAEKSAHMVKQLGQSATEQEEMKQQIEELNKKLDDAQAKINQHVVREKEQKHENKELKSKVNDLSGQIQELEQVKQRQEEKIANNEQVIQDLETKNENLEKEVKDVTSKVQQAAEQHAEQRKDIEQLQSEKQELQNLVDNIQSSVGSAGNLPQAVNDAMKDKETAEILMDMLSAANRDEATKKLNELSEHSQVLKAIQDVLPTHDLADLPKFVQNLRDDTERLKAEKEKLSQMLSCDPNGDLSTTIQELIEQREKFTEQMNAAADFVSLVLSIITGPSIAQARLSFPLKQVIKDKLIDLVTRIKKRADTDHEQVDRVLEKARSAGYHGEDVMEAVAFISMREIEIERQQTLSMIGRELGDVQSLSASQKEAYAKDKAKSRKKIAKLRESLAEQMTKATQREQELKEENEELMKKNRELASDLETERKVREELGRIGAGLSYDKSYLTCKLSKNELRLITLAEQTSKTINQRET